MTFEKAHGRVTMHASPVSGYNRYVCQMVLNKTIHALTRESDLEKKGKTKPITKFESVLKN